MIDLKKVYKGKKCLVTGGKGFIGSALVKALRALDADVYVLDNRHTDRIDIRTYDTVLNAINYSDCVFHLAAKTEVAESTIDPYAYYSTNVLGTMNVLLACRWYETKSVVIGSTDKVYGNQRIPYKESMNLLSSSDPYSNSKRSADIIAQDMRSMFNMPIIILRSCNTYGPGQDNDTTLIVRSIKNLLSGKSPVVHIGMESAIREWLYINDAVKAYLYAGAFNLLNFPNSGIWNVGSGECRSVIEVISAIKNNLNIFNPSVTCNDNVERVSEQSVNCSEMKKAIQQYLDVKWEPIRFDEGIKRTIDYFKN